MCKTFSVIRAFGMAGFAGLLAVSTPLTSNALAQERELNPFDRDRYHTPYWVFAAPFRHDGYYPAPGDSVSSPPLQIVVEPPASTWYYCESARSYYPYVPECKEGWLSVSALPPRARWRSTLQSL